MMVSAAVSSRGKAEENLIASFRDSATLRTWIGASGDEATQKAQANDRIHLDGLPGPEDGEEHTLEELHRRRPYVIVYTDDTSGGFRREHDAMSTVHQYSAVGRLKAYLEQDAREAIIKNVAELNREFKNTVEGIVDDLEALSGQAGYLAFASVDFEDGPRLSHPFEKPTQGVYQYCLLSFSWEGL